MWCAIDLQLVTHYELQLQLNLLKKCEANGTTAMICPLPLLNLPPGFNSSTQREGLAAATVRNGNVTVNIYIGFILDGIKKYSNTSKSLPNITFTLVPINIKFSNTDAVLVYDPSDGKPLSIVVSELHSVSLLRTKYKVLHTVLYNTIQYQSFYYANRSVAPHST